MSTCCCPVTAEPALAVAPHVGTTITYGSTTLYVAGPAKAKSGILAFPDIYGLESGRTKADADALGKLRNNFDVLLPRIHDAIAYHKTEVGVETFASYGYCWGGWGGATLTASETPIVTGHVSFHPTWRIENIINGENAVDKLAERVKVVPQLLLSAGDDPAFVREGGSVEKILKSRSDISALSEVIDFPNQNHGWVHRGDLSNEATKEAVKKAWHLAVKFLQTVNPPQ